MLEGSSRKIVGYSDIKYALGLIGKNVDKVAFGHVAPIRCFPGAVQHVAKRSDALQPRDRYGLRAAAPRLRRPRICGAALRAAPRPGNAIGYAGIGTSPTSFGTL